ncbi:MAG TPA: hypothetical protein VKR41_11110 [Puia sp.]|nr:hypothetical protein [Puia sp.]
MSEAGDIERFEPRPSPSHFDAITGDVVFAIAGHLLHNYLLPRDCPRVTYYANSATTLQDLDRFLSGSDATHVVAIETEWFHRVNTTVLYAYEFPAANFTLLDETAGYYISYEPVIPAGVRRIDNIFVELLSRAHLELRILPELWSLGNAVIASTLSFSLIRMRNAKK